MMNKSKIARLLTMNIALAGFVLISGHFVETDAQARDPFTKPGWARTRTPSTGAPASPGTPGTTGNSSSTAAKKKTPGATLKLGTPAIEQRIEFFKRLRENATANGQPLPKVTSVLTLDELAVTGIFRTPRGYAAMVEATPIKLSYTIYPGDKFFDGQLVAVEEHRLVFRRVTKVGTGKFVSSVENKPLREYTTKELIQGTAPADGRPPENVATYQSAAEATQAKPTIVIPVISPLDEMNKQLPNTDSDKEKSKKSGKKPVKVARNK